MNFLAITDQKANNSQIKIDITTSKEKNTYNYVIPTKNSNQNIFLAKLIVAGHYLFSPDKRIEDEDISVNAISNSNYEGLLSDFKKNEDDLILNIDESPTTKPGKLQNLNVLYKSMLLSETTHPFLYDTKNQGSLCRLLRTTSENKEVSLFQALNTQNKPYAIPTNYVKQKKGITGFHKIQKPYTRSPVFYLYARDLTSENSKNLFDDPVNSDLVQTKTPFLDSGCSLYTNEQGKLSVVSILKAIGTEIKSGLKK